MFDRPVVGRELGDVLAPEQDASGAGLLEAGQHAQQGRFAAAGGAEQAEEVAAPKFEADRVDGDYSP